MKTSALVVALYGLLVLFGSLIGYFKAGSLPSLLAGLLFGPLLLASSLATFKDKRIGLYASLILVFLLDAFFTFRFAKSHALFPSGVMSLASLATLLSVALAVRKTTARKANL